MLEELKKKLFDIEFNQTILADALAVLKRVPELREDVLFLKTMLENIK